MSKKKEISSDQSSENQSPGRRDALKKILVGAGVVTGAQLLPDEWTKPVVDSIIVPAHAQSSGGGPVPSTTSAVPVSPTQPPVSPTPPPGSTTSTPGTTPGVPVSPTPPPG